MNTHLVKDIDKLKIKILNMALRVEENVINGVKALREVSLPLAKEVISVDKIIDELEVEIEEDCLKILALHQPVASDLRFVITVLKINNELERIADMASNIALRVQYINVDKKFRIPFDIVSMSGDAIKMLKNSLNAFIRGDEKLALEVCLADDAIDNENKKCYASAEQCIKEDVESTGTFINYLLVCKSIERIADMCTNIAEDVIYMKRSLIVRHNLAEAKKIIINK